MFEDLFNNIWQWTNSLPDSIQFIAVFIAGAIPLLEGQVAAAIGVAVGVHPVIAATSAIIGNVVSMLAITLLTDGLHARLTRDKEQKSDKNQRLLELYHKYGVPLTTLIAQVWVPAGITTILLISIGASKRQVIIWQTISIIVWTVGMTLVVTGAISAFA